MANESHHLAGAFAFVARHPFSFRGDVLTAVKPRSEVFSYPPRWLPTSFRWENFVDMWHAANFGSALWNSLVISIGATILVLIVSVPAAYAIARFTLH
jgi:multiple sugar transport system permease protein